MCLYLKMDPRVSLNRMKVEKVELKWSKKMIISYGTNIFLTKSVKEIFKKPKHDKIN